MNLDRIMKDANRQVKQWTLQDEAKAIIRTQSYQSLQEDDIFEMALTDSREDLRKLEAEERYLTHKEGIQRILHDHQMPLLLMMEFHKARASLHKKKLEIKRAMLTCMKFRARLQEESPFHAPRAVKAVHPDLLNHDD